MAERSTQLRVINISKTSPGLVECVVWNFKDPVRVGDTLCIEGASSNGPDEGFEILEIMLLVHLFDELPTNFNAQLLLAGKYPDRLRVDQLLYRCESGIADGFDSDQLLESSEND